MKLSNHNNQPDPLSLGIDYGLPVSPPREQGAI